MLDYKPISLVLILLGLFGSSISILLGFIWVPGIDPESVQQGSAESYRILFWHVSFAWCSFLAFLMLFVGSILWYLKNDEFGWRLFSTGSDMGLLFGFGVITSGPIWGSVAWGKPWDWGDLRLNSFALLTAVAIFLVLSRKSQPDTTQTRDTLSIIGLFGFFLVPITAVATTLYNRRHPPIIIIEGEDTGLPDEWLMVLIFSFVSFGIMFIGISLLNDIVNQLESKTEKYQRIIDRGED
ncbi:MAG: cytochrome c biogenesis protein CcsA [Candidatus Thalassarchaeaceae archaeon]